MFTRRAGAAAGVIPMQCYSPRHVYRAANVCTQWSAWKVPGCCCREGRSDKVCNNKQRTRVRRLLAAARHDRLGQLINPWRSQRNQWNQQAGRRSDGNGKTTGAECGRASTEPPRAFGDYMAEVVAAGGWQGEAGFLFVTQLPPTFQVHETLSE